jgi:hypothetical protein
VMNNKDARASLDVEWKRLRDKLVWDEYIIREWSDVAWEAQQNGFEVNLGYLFALCVEKNSELPVGHPKRKYKGRVVFQGNRVTNQNWEAAIFQDLGSWPPATVSKSPTLSRHTSKLSSLELHAGFACLPISGPRK